MLTTLLFMYVIAPTVDQTMLELKCDFVTLQKALVGFKRVLD